MSRYSYITLFKSGKWRIEMRASRRSGWAVGPRHVDGWVCHPSGRAAFDFPERVPKGVKAKINKHCSRTIGGIPAGLGR